MYDEIGMQELRQNLSRILDHLAAGGPRLMITRNGKEVGALVSAHDLRALEQAASSRMAHHQKLHEAQLREIRWLKEGLDGARGEDVGRA